MMFSIRNWFLAGALSIVAHGSATFLASSPSTDHIAKAAGDQVAFAGALSQFVPSPQILKVEPNQVRKTSNESVKPTENTPIKKATQPPRKLVVKDKKAALVTPIEKPVQKAKPAKQLKPTVSNDIAEKSFEVLNVERVDAGQTVDQPVSEVVETVTSTTSVKTESIKVAVLSKPELTQTKITPSIQKPTTQATVKTTVQEPVKSRVMVLKPVPKPVLKQKVVKKKKRIKKKKKAKNRRLARLSSAASAPGRKGSRSRKNGKSGKAGDRGRSQQISGRAELNDYRGMVQLRLRRQQRYPRRAKSRGIKGTAYLSFTIMRSGRVRGARIYRSSGHKILDSEVRAMIARAAPFPAFPKAIRKSSMRLSIPVVFNIR